MATIYFEHHETELLEIRTLIVAGEYTEAKERATTKLAECRAAWGYNGRTETHRNYLRDYNHLRACCCRGETGLPLYL